jgi:hypothetical protein
MVPKMADPGVCLPGETAAAVPAPPGRPPCELPVVLLLALSLSRTVVPTGPAPSSALTAI